MDLLDTADLLRIDATRKLNRATRSALGQFMTPAVVARHMASLLHAEAEAVAILDPGAGVGSLSAALVQSLLDSKTPPRSIEIDAYEVEPLLAEYLTTTLDECKRAARARKVRLTFKIIPHDFIAAGTEHLRSSEELFGNKPRRYTHCIMNPPYKKISTSSEHRRLLRAVGVETSNLYTAFLAVAIKLLQPGGQLSAIVPRSFCNGTYFRPFRNMLLDEMALRTIHVFEDRDRAFAEDEVLQENIIFSAARAVRQGKVTITASSGGGFDDLTERKVDFGKVVRPGDPERFIHITPSDTDEAVENRMRAFTHHLRDMGLDCCTGPVVAFRQWDDVREAPETEACPLIYPNHLEGSRVAWPKPNGRKPNAIVISDESRKWLMPNGWYVLTRRFSAKEERRRIVAAVYDPSLTKSPLVGFENKLNVLHGNLTEHEAHGLALYLNSTLVDLYFRQFSGHTQVNAGDLRKLPYPDRATLARLGQKCGATLPDQAGIDALLDAVVGLRGDDPLSIKRKTEDALRILAALGLPRGQRNERSALVLLALLNLGPDEEWSIARDPLMGITPMMDFIRDYYGKKYAPNTRETVRRQTMHQYVQAGLAVENPDQPDRPVNSPKWCYQVAPAALALLRTWGQSSWDAGLTAYLAKRKTLAEQYAREREMEKIPLALADGKQLMLSPGAHSQLIKQIVEDFGPRFAPGGTVLYVGDTGAKLEHFDEATFAKLGLAFDSHGKFPDVVIYSKVNNWLLLVESVTSHGPVDPKRHRELEELFARSAAGLVFVTAFPDRQTMARYLPEISWETEVWTADAPTHLIHFNGERFLGPHEPTRS